MFVTKWVDCSVCDCEVAIEVEVTIDVKTAAHELLSTYGGPKVYSGDAIKLENAIRKCLVEEIGISSSKVYHEHEDI